MWVSAKLQISLCFNVSLASIFSLSLVGPSSSLFGDHIKPNHDALLTPTKYYFVPKPKQSVGTVLCVKERNTKFNRNKRKVPNFSNFQHLVLQKHSWQLGCSCRCRRKLCRKDVVCGAFAYCEDVGGTNMNV